jgi:hypothetical protein
MKKEKTVKTAKAPKLVSYTIKATIPTCMYGNIQPEITVMAGTLEEVEKFVLPHINKLFVDYTEEPINKRLRFITAAQTVTPANVIPQGASLAPLSKEGLENAMALAKEQSPKGGTVMHAQGGEYLNTDGSEIVIPPPEKQSEALKKALDAIAACKNKDVYTLIGKKICESTRLTYEEKEIAMSVWDKKHV